MKRGRKPATDLVAMPDVAELPRHPDPPIGLGEAARARWIDIVRDWPIDRWRPSDMKLLEDLVITEGYVSDCDELIARDGATIPGGRGAMVGHPAVAMRRMHMQTILGIQRALRLCPSTRMLRDKASLNERPGSAGKRPWERKG